MKTGRTRIVNALYVISIKSEPGVWGIRSVEREAYTELAVNEIRLGRVHNDVLTSTKVVISRYATTRCNCQLH